MDFDVLQAIFACTLSWFLWKYFRQFFLSSPLDNIPGPPSKSWLYGESPGSLRARTRIQYLCQAI